MPYILDSHAWVEYFIGSHKGEMLKKLFLDEKHRFVTVECCLAELQGWALKNKQDFDSLFRIIRANSTIVPITEHDWIDAGKERFEQRKTQKDFGLIDAVILIKQQQCSGFIVTGDNHFNGKKNIVFIG